MRGSTDTNFVLYNHLQDFCANILFYNHIHFFKAEIENQCKRYHILMHFLIHHQVTSFLIFR